MGSRDVSRWVFKLTADPICPPLIPEWYLSLLEFYIVSSVSKSVLHFPKLLFFRQTTLRISLQFPEWNTDSTPTCSDFLIRWGLLTELLPGAPFPILPIVQIPFCRLITVHSTWWTGPKWLQFVPGNGPIVKIARILMALFFLHCI